MSPHTPLFLALLSAALSVFPASAQTLSSADLLKTLRQGGHVIVMRHTSSPRDVPAKAAANPDNVTPERQLDATGRTTATAMGKAFRDLSIPIGTVLASPTYRALETARYAQFPTPRPIPELGDNGQSMQGGTAAQSAWLRKQVTQFPKGTNTLLITHLPNLAEAFPDLAKDMEDGEAIIFGPDGKGGARSIARVKVEAWSTLRP